MKKLLLFCVISGTILNGAEEKNERVITINNATKDITEHITDYLKVVDVSVIANQPKVLQSPEPEVQHTSWGFSSYIFGAPKKAIKNAPINVKDHSTLLDSMKLYSFDHETAVLFNPIKQIDVFLNNYASIVREGNFSIYHYNDWNELDSKEKTITYVFIGAMAKQAVSYYFAQGITALMGFEHLEYYPLTTEVSVDNNQHNNYRHSTISKENLLPSLFKYLRAKKKKSSERNYKENLLLKELQLINYAQNEPCLGQFTILESNDSFQEHHLANLLQGKFYIYHTSECDDQHLSSFSKGSSRNDLTRVFIGEGVSKLTPHDYCISLMQKGQMANALFDSAI